MAERPKIVQIGGLRGSHTFAEADDGSVFFNNDTDNVTITLPGNGGAHMPVGVGGTAIQRSTGTLTDASTHP